ncbi:unnamed protein product [Amoebophrya sp. A25]|nr:unnamed protein product [Amoebophrya sp. A25]|eukprot:GSA25T00024183001.1
MEDSASTPIPPEEDKLAPPSEIFSFEVLKTARANQDANGLRHNDHYRYRQYCTRRLARLYKSAKRTHGKGKFKDSPVTEIKSLQDLEIILVQTERNWSFFQQLKADNAVKAHYSYATRQHGVRKLRKASTCARMLNRFAQHTCDLRTQKQTEAYELYMEALLLMEQEKFQDAGSKLEKCKSAYERLAAASKDSELYQSMVTEIEPLLKRASHNAGVLGLGGSAASKTASKQSSKSSPTDSEMVISTYEFRDSIVDCCSDPIHQLIESALEAKTKARSVLSSASGASSSSSSSTVFDEAASQMQQALSIIHEEMLKTGDRMKPLENMCREQLAAIYLERDMLFLSRLAGRLGAVEDLGSKTMRPEEGVRFAELIKAELERLQNLPGQFEVSSALTLLNNVRGFFVGLCYMCCKKYTEAASILELVRGRMEMQGTEVEELSEPLARFGELLTKLGEELPNKATCWHARALALSITTTAPEVSGSSSSSSGGLAFPSSLKLQTLTVPPMILDLAGMELQPPNLNDLVPQKKGKIRNLGAKVAGALGGLFGRRG